MTNLCERMWSNLQDVLVSKESSVQNSTYNTQFLAKERWGNKEIFTCLSEQKEIQKG